MNVDGKAAIVTGGATGIGRATALALASRGCAVLVNYRRSASEAERTVDDVRRIGGRAVSHAADVSVDSECRAMVDVAVREFGRLDVLVQSAGTTTFIDMSDVDAVREEHWERIFAVNVRGAFQCARAARRAIETSGGGEIVNVSSVAGIIGGGSSIPYSASKAALNNLTANLARTFGPHIRVNAVAPGFVTGRWTEEGLGPAYESVKKWTEARTALRAVCQPSDVADAIVSLITGSDLVTGQTFRVDGGLPGGL